MDSKTAHVLQIVKAALSIFHEKGYNQANVREIASAAGVSLGMINHYFGSKEFLGTQCLQILSDYSMSLLNENLSIENEPILYDLVSVRALYQYLNRYGYETFYRESLENDFFLKYLSDYPTTIVRILSRTYPIEATEDEIQLYSRYLPYMMEKTLVLKKHAGLFTSIDYEQIPYIIVATALNRFIPEQAIKDRDAESIRIAEEIISPLEPSVPDDFLLGFVERYVKRLEDTNASQKASWIRKMKLV